MVPVLGTNTPPCLSHQMQPQGHGAGFEGSQSKQQQADWGGEKNNSKSTKPEWVYFSPLPSHRAAQHPEVGPSISPRA